MIAPPPKAIRGFTLIQLLVTIVLSGLIISILLPSFIQARDHALESEVQSNVHSIQIALERYATDNGGFYPAYIFGGDLASWNVAGDPVDVFNRRIHDPLLKFGYLVSYPPNPFLSVSSGLCPLTNADPRFGCRTAPAPCSVTQPCGGDIMGNALSDPAWPDPDESPDSSQTWRFGTLSPTGRRCLHMTTPNCAYYFIGDDDAKTVDFIPGEFFYRTFGAPFHGDTFQPSPPSARFLPVVYATYILGGFGAVRMAGKDVFHCWSAIGIRAEGYEREKRITYFENPKPGTHGADDGCVARGTDAFDSSRLWQNEPSYGGFCIGLTGPPLIGNCAGGPVSELPNIVFTPVRGSVAVGTELDFPNPDGRADGILVWLVPGWPE